MALVPHKITALAESDADGTDGKNIIAGAVVSMFDINGDAAILYDDENGANGSTTKQTDANGVVVVYVEEGEYDEQANNGVKRRVLIGSKSNNIISYATTAEIESLRPQRTGSRIENRERANAQYVLAAAGYVAQPGDITAANGRVWALVVNGFAKVRWFGAKGDGSIESTSAITNAMQSGLPLDWEDLAYVLSGPITHTYNEDLLWKGAGARIKYEGPHIGDFVNISMNGEFSVDISGVTIDGNLLSNRVCSFYNNTTNDTASSFKSEKFFCENARRDSTFSGGECLLIRGAWSSVDLGGGVKNAELPIGQGTPGVIGISGVGINFYSINSYVKSVYIGDFSVEKVFSSDLGYQFDQDGLQYFAPFLSGSEGERAPSQITVSSQAKFKNCYGRSVKTQCRTTVIEDGASFLRNEGLTSGVGNPEIDAQQGDLFVGKIICTYENSQIPDVITNCTSSANQQSDMSVIGAICYLDASTSLNYVARTFPNGGPMGDVNISKCKVFGEAEGLIDYACNGESNFATIENNYIKDISVGPTGDRNFIYALASGLGPFYGFVKSQGNVYGGNQEVALLRDAIPGNSMRCEVSSLNDHGFIRDLKSSPGSTGQKRNTIARLGLIGSYDDSAGALTGAFGVETKAIASGATETFSIYRISGAMAFIMARFGQTGYANITTTDSTNLVINKGSSFEVGTNSEPATGVFRVWSSGPNELSIKNTNSSTRVVSVFSISP